MMKKTFLSLLVALLSIGAWADTTYKTSTGAVFTQVEREGFGKAWKDPSGMIWSSYQGDFSNEPLRPDQDGLVTDSPATEACAKINGSLPRMQDYKRFVSYFELDSDHYFLTAQGKTDMYAIFPDMAHGFFWSATVLPDRPQVGNTFSGTSGTIDGGWNFFFLRDMKQAVRCVARETGE